MTTRADPAEIAARMDALAAELARQGWSSRIDAPPGRQPSLYARNPEPGASVLSERIYAGPPEDGTWWFWWPWGEPIAADPGRAAAVIVRVLRPADD
ncbi:MAG: hypothetical protein ACLQDY_07660 [Streptosporangiaceae bacterium]